MLNREGFFKARAKKLDDGSRVMFTKAKTGNYQVYVNFEILDGEPEDVGQTIGWFGSLAGGAVDKTIQGLRAMGLSGDEIGEAVSQPMDSEVSIKVEFKEFEGKSRLRVSFVNPLQSAGISTENRITGLALKQFSAAMKAKLQAIGGGQPAQKKAPAPAPAASPDPDADGDAY